MTVDVMQVNHDCQLCNANDFEAISDTDRDGLGLDTVVCRQCGLISHAHIPSEFELSKYYGESYRLDYQGEDRPLPHRFIREWRRGQARFRQLAPFLRPRDHILDIGSGMGCTLKQFELAGYTAQGIEPGLGFSQFACERLKCLVERVELHELPPIPRYDFVVLAHVLEHLPSPGDSLRTVHDLLRSGGRVYVEVPNLAAPPAAPHRLFHPAHIHNFATWTLIPLALLHGFDVLAILSADCDRNLAVVLARSSLGRLDLDPSGYEKSMRALRRYSWFSYCLRWRYLWDQLKKQVMQLSDRVLAVTRLAEIEQQCSAMHLAKSLAGDRAGLSSRSVVAAIESYRKAS